MPAIAPQGREVKKTTKFEETIPAVDAAAAEPSNPDCFDYMAGVLPEDWINHIVYVYRQEPRTVNAGGPGYLEKCTGPFDIEYLREKWGGTVFRIIVKRGSERVSEHTYQIEAPPKFPAAAQSAAPAPAVPADPNASLGMRALEMVGGPQAETFRALLDVFREASKAAIDQVRAQSMNAAPQKSAKEELLETLNLIKALNGDSAVKAKSPMELAVESAMTTMVQNMLSPKNPIEDFKTMAAAISSVQSLTGGGSNRGGGLVSEVVAALPGAIREATGMLREIRMNNEVMARTTPMPPPRAANPSQPANVVTMPSPAAHDSGQGPIEVQPPDPNWVKLRIVQMLAVPDTTAGDIAEWLRDTMPEMLQQLSMATPEQILGLFKSDPVLAHAATNPRLPQFVNEFVAYLHEVPTTAENAAPPKPPA